MIGACSYTDTPDYWHPQSTRGAMTKEAKAELRKNTLTALSICKSCPVREQCLEKGMQEENLPWGIWGGKLAGERILSTGNTYPQGSDCGEALRIHRFLLSVLEG